MNIFSEIYGLYFRIVETALKNKTITSGEIRDLVVEKGFSETNGTLPYKLCPQKDFSDWGLLREEEKGVYSRVTQHEPVKIMTGLQRAWLKAKLLDPKAGLFLSDEEIAELDERLSDVKPMYTPEQYRYSDKFSGGDNYRDKRYRKNFRAVLNAVKSREIIKIEYLNRYKDLKYIRCVPVKIQFSEKNDVFRVYACGIRNDKSTGCSVINIGRISKVKGTGKFYKNELSVNELFAERICADPAIIKVTTERNARERFLVEFAAYEKEAEMNPETGECTVTLKYDKNDETEILIRLLSFGPIIEIIGPPALRNKAAERVRMQAELMGI